MSCPSFYGNEKDKLAFKNWFAQYETIIKANKGWSESFKLSFLKSKVVDLAAPYIAHFDPEDGNYEAAINALEAQYLDVPYIINEQRHI